MSGAPLLLACVYPYEPPLYVGSDEYQAMLRSDAETALSLASANLPCDLPADFETLAVSSPPPARGMKPAAALQDLAETRSTEVIVVGSCHRGGLGRALVGSVGERLLHGAPCAVAVAARGFQDRVSSLTALGVAFDGRRESEAALQLAARVARSNGAPLRLISALEPLQWMHASLSPGYSISWLDESRKAMHALQAETIARISDGLVIDGVVREGAAADVLTEESERDLDLLVLGSRGYGPLGRILLGGVSHHVARNAGCSVLIAPRPDARTGDEEEVSAGSQSTVRTPRGRRRGTFSPWLPSRPNAPRVNGS